LLKDAWNLDSRQKERLSTLVRWNSPLVRSWYLKESFQLFWAYKQPWRAKQHLLKWMTLAIEAGAIQEIRGHAPAAPGRGPRLGQHAAFERSR